MSVILGIDTSSTDLGIGLHKDGKPLASVSRFVRNSHAEHITEAVKMLLKLNSVDPSEVTHVAIPVGPGSFTGLRIGIAFVKGFCASNNRKVLPLSTLNVMAASFKTPVETRIFSAIDARNDEIYWASFSIKDGKMLRLSDDKISGIDELLETSTPDDIIITDKMGFSRSTIFKALENKRNTLAVENDPVHRGFVTSAIASSFLDDSSLWCDAFELKPNYLRLSYAQKKAS
ncbi:tRNA (adenosine(37)-N6)-threonylcarbamoyltransferase complex dimerization subunit type 1 TsaB [Chitinispirillales bacterium ANBcel5]|uniref:tRNA (adenosine(37)-N6)-threonylcarbamoyltransferase complex dimerization subunit type 1 TsaB n=1 Tax=Cellulosispirillum alkaliphilum TaxID=3039283 RepID=UPI002A4E6753|nr:tRNA (adenosine(37)-N6)-threonylcarbamoyltransferase complex dimerization subunit type 1 TsaB [Chitinispirillales bacterium ANBcel5]